MSNYEMIKSMNEQELADYIKSVYLTGVMVGKGTLPKDEKFVSLDEWLSSEHVG